MKSKSVLLSVFIILLLTANGLSAVDSKNSVSEVTGNLSFFSWMKAMQEEMETSHAEEDIKLEVLRKGDGVHFPKVGQLVFVDYVATLKNGSKFDSTYDNKAPVIFRVGQGQVIKGLDIAVRKLSKGEKARATIPSSLAFGSKEIKGKLPPNSDLFIELVLVDIK